jgi:sulfotransferase family protein
LGAPRSGTSAVTNLVNALGVPATSEEDLKAADAGNPRGYWESASLIDMNERVLSKVGASWLSPPALASGLERNPSVTGLAEDARAAFSRVRPGRAWVWKDPRNCFTLRFWLGVTEAAPVIVLMYRHPFEVADSFARRNGLSAPLALALWERYNRAALDSAAGLPTLVLRYERLVRNPAAAQSELQAFLRDRGLELAATSPAGASSVIDPALRRSDRPPADSGERLSEPQTALLEALKEAEGVHDALPPVDLPEETDWVEPLLQERRRVLTVDDERRRLEARIGRTLNLRPLGIELRLVPGSALARALVSTRDVARRLRP